MAESLQDRVERLTTDLRALHLDEHAQVLADLYVSEEASLRVEDAWRTRAIAAEEALSGCPGYEYEETGVESPEGVREYVKAPCQHEHLATRVRDLADSWANVAAVHGPEDTVFLTYVYAGHAAALRSLVDD